MLAKFGQNFEVGKENLGEKILPEFGSLPKIKGLGEMYGRLPHGYPTVTPRLLHGYPTVTPRLPHGYPTVTPRVPAVCIFAEGVLFRASQS